MSFTKLCKDLEIKIQNSYTDGVTLEMAEKLAGEFLRAQMQVSDELKKADLDARMRKTGLKAVKASVYTTTCAKADKKPTESALEHIINDDSVVISEQRALDTAEVDKDDLTRYYNIFREAHIYYRGIAKGKFE